MSDSCEIPSLGVKGTCKPTRMFLTFRETSLGPASEAWGSYKVFVSLRSNGATDSSASTPRVCLYILLWVATFPKNVIHSKPSITCGPKSEPGIFMT